MFIKSLVASKWDNNIVAALLTLLVMTFSVSMALREICHQPVYPIVVPVKKSRRRRGDEMEADTTYGSSYSKAVLTTK
jgi:hypothetical protein